MFPLVTNTCFSQGNCYGIIVISVQESNANFEFRKLMQFVIESNLSLFLSWLLAYFSCAVHSFMTTAIDTFPEDVNHPA